MTTIMNSGTPREVEPENHRTRHTLWCALTTVMCLGVHGCIEATGGAVELSWALRTTRDVGISDCLDGRIGKIRLWWDTPDSLRYRSFPCRDNHGVTAFDLDVRDLPDDQSEQVALRVTPECRDGSAADPASFITPPPIVRTVTEGETITLDAVLIVLRVDEEDCTTLPCVCP